MTYLQATTNYTVDLVLALLLAAGSTVGAQIGARVSRYLKGDQLLIILASLALIVVFKMVISLFSTPASLLSPVAEGGHAHLRIEDSKRIVAYTEPPKAEDYLPIQAWFLKGDAK